MFSKIFSFCFVFASIGLANLSAQEDGSFKTNIKSFDVVLMGPLTYGGQSKILENHDVFVASTATFLSDGAEPMFVLAPAGQQEMMKRDDLIFTFKMKKVKFIGEDGDEITDEVLVLQGEPLSKDEHFDEILKAFSIVPLVRQRELQINEVYYREVGKSAVEVWTIGTYSSQCAAPKTEEVHYSTKIPLIDGKRVMEIKIYDTEKHCGGWVRPVIRSVRFPLGPSPKSLGAEKLFVNGIEAQLVP